MKQFILTLALALSTACFAATTHTVTFMWSLSPDYTHSQAVYRQKNCVGAFVRREMLSNTAVEWTDTHVADGATYCYMVTAIYPDGGTANSNVVTVTIP